MGKSGLKAFANYELQHFTLPEIGDDSRPYFKSYNRNKLSIGGQLLKTGSDAAL